MGVGVGVGGGGGGGGTNWSRGFFLFQFFVSAFYSSASRIFPHSSWHPILITYLILSTAGAKISNGYEPHPHPHRKQIVSLF